MTVTQPEPAMTAPARRADLAWLSWLRFLCISGVVSIHVLARNVLEDNARETLRGTVAIYVNQGFSFAVPVFVMLSGATLLSPSRYTGPGPFLRKRALRVLPPLVWWHLWYLAFLRYRDGSWLSPEEIWSLTINGRLYTALYFFWIILGLSLFAVILVPFVATSSRRQLVVAAVVLAAIPPMMTATRETRPEAMTYVVTAWTWWIPYLGLFLLGYALRGVVVRGAALFIGANLLLPALFLLHGYLWNNPEAPAILNRLAPPSYFSALTVLLSALVFVIFQSVVREGGVLSGLAHGRGAKVGRQLGDATMGVFGLHLTVMYVAERHVFGTADFTAAGTTHLVVRTLVVLVVTYALVLALRRVPVVRSVL